MHSELTPFASWCEFEQSLAPSSLSRSISTTLTFLAMSTTVPIIDLSPFLNNLDEASKRASADAIGKAAREVGFFYVQGFMKPIASGDAAVTHIDEVLEACGDFFAQPEGIKNAVDATNSTMHRGYVDSRKTGSATCVPGQGRPDYKESFMIGAVGDISPMHGGD